MYNTQRCTKPEGKCVYPCLSFITNMVGTQQRFLVFLNQVCAYCAPGFSKLLLSRKSVCMLVCVCVYVCVRVPNHSREMKPKGSRLTGNKAPGF